jgi:hypothetical protein
MAKQRGKGRFRQTEIERMGRAAKNLGADIEVNPATGTIRMIFKDGEAACQDQPKNNPWDEVYAQNQKRSA